MILLEETHDANKQIKFKTTILKSSVFNEYIRVTGNVTINRQRADTPAKALVGRNISSIVNKKNPFTTTWQKLIKHQ